MNFSQLKNTDEGEKALPLAALAEPSASGNGL